MSLSQSGAAAISMSYIMSNDLIFLFSAPSQSLSHSSVGGSNSSLSIQHQQSHMSSSNQTSSATFFSQQEEMSSPNDNQVGMPSTLGNKYKNNGHYH